MGRAIVMALGTVMAGIWMATPVLAEIESSVVDSLAYKSYHQRKPTLEKANDAAAAKGLTLEALGKACNLMPIRIGAVLTGQAPLEQKSQECLESQLGLKPSELAPLRTPPVRWNAGAIYRIHEAADVYAPAIQRWMNEHFGDAIMSAIDFVVQVEEVKGSHGEKRIRIIFDGKALPYSSDEGWAP
jgi:cyanate lyase